MIKKCALLFPIVLVFCMTIISLFAFAEEDYSYLDNMTINQLKKLDEEIHKRLPSSSSSADVTTVNISLSNSGKTDSNEEYAFDEPVTVLDNEYLKMDFIGKFVEYDKAGQPKKMGYKVIVENKTDKYLDMATVTASIDGFTLSDTAGPYTSFRSISAHNKANGEYYIPLDGREIGVELKSLDDLKELDAVVQVHRSEDGATWSSNDSVNLSFLCKVP